MRAPWILARMKQTGETTAHGIMARHTGIFVTVAVETCPGEVAKNGFSTVLDGLDVIGMKRGLCGSLRQVAVLTSLPRATRSAGCKLA
jgi:hypothetical protein